jgi:hypothetical protein
MSTIKIKQAMSKKNLLIAIAAFLTVNVWGQTNTFPATGNVGIGTDTPAREMEVTGTGNV